jgi:hypothetical protein
VDAWAGATPFGSRVFGCDNKTVRINTASVEAWITCGTSFEVPGSRQAACRNLGERLCVVGNRARNQYERGAMKNSKRRSSVDRGGRYLNRRPHAPQAKTTKNQRYHSISENCTEPSVGERIGARSEMLNRYCRTPSQPTRSSIRSALNGDGLT